MSILHAIILGITQGLCEFLPISSSGHLILVPWLFGWNDFNGDLALEKTFDVALHLGTFISLLLYFWRDAVEILVAWGHSVRKRRTETETERLAWLLIISTIPAGLAGLALESFVEETLGQPYLIAIMLIVFGIVLWVADRIAKRDRDVSSVNKKGALAIGTAQVLALAPGVSRSGITMTAALLLRLDRESAARYAFLMSLPVIGSAALYKLLKLFVDGMPEGAAVPFAVGVVSATVSGFIAVWFMLAFLRKNTFTRFVIYRLVLGAAVLIIIAAGWRSATIG